MSRHRYGPALKEAWKTQASRPFPGTTASPDPAVAEVDSKVAGALKTLLDGELPAEEHRQQLSVLEDLRRELEAVAGSSSEEERLYLMGWVTIVDSVTAAS